MKIISFFIIFCFSACILCAPVFAFADRFFNGTEAFQSAKTNGFSADIVFSGNTASKLDSFTKNIKTPYNKIIGFSNTFALITSFTHSFAQKSGKNILNFSKLFDFTINSSIFNSDRLRLRTRHTQNESPLGVFFILLYIGMLRAVFIFSKNHIFYIKKPLFA